MSACGPAVPTATSHAVQHPLGLADVRLTGGLLAQLRRVNRTASLPMGIEQLEAAGNFDNLRLAAGEGEGEYRGPVYMDSDVTKLLETAAWELATEPDQALETFVTEATELLENAQQKDGYLNSSYQVKAPGERYTNLSGSHELYCAGHLMQAAVAAHRSVSDTRLLDVARRFADHLVEEFLDGTNTGLDGHPEVETALVELYRDTGDERYLRLAGKFVDERGKGLVGRTAKGPENYQDHLPVRVAPTLLGHAVRALYLEAGVVDVYLETGDESLLRTSIARWDDMVATKTAITGGQGSRLLREAFGDRYELPPDLAFNETCTAAASIHWAWRLLLATGDARYAELIERTLYNGFAAATSLDGLRFFKGNPLQRRADHFPFEHEARRSGWFWSACCPPNVTRLLASLPGYVATTAGDTLYLQQFSAGTVSARLADGPVSLDVETDYPWAGEVTVTVREAPASLCGLALRVPSWSRRTRVFVGDIEHDSRPDEHGYVVLRRHWRAGETVRLELDVTPRLTYPDRRLDAVRGCVAIERGPLVYCVEQVDQPAGVSVDDLAVPADCSPRAVDLTDDPLLGRTIALDVDADLHTDAGTGLPYSPAPQPGSMRTVTARAIPYFQWDNRDGGAMRVWLPVRT
jgi:DUF1680 family protein